MVFASRGSRFPRRELRQVALILAGLLVLELLAWLPSATAAPRVVGIGGAEAAPRVFDGGSDGVRDRTGLTYRLGAALPVTVVVVDHRGGGVRTLRAKAATAAGTHVAWWDGTTAAGTPAMDGGYRFRLTIHHSTGDVTTEHPVTKAPLELFPANPGAITVALDAGHGGSDPGAVRDGFTEASANVDIALRLRAMLEGAGVRVVQSRTADTRVNVGNVDWTGDGQVGYADELASRVEIANRARAAVFLCIHNNSSSSSAAAGTETYYYRHRAFAPESLSLANLVQARVVSSLRTHSSTWKPVDRGVRSYDFYVLNGFSATSRPRPSLMPGILSEGLFVSNAADRAVLRSSSGRQRIAQGYYDGLARWFAQRAHGAAYELIGREPASRAEGSAAASRVRVTNTSARTWAAGSVALTVAAVPAVPYYDGSGAAGSLLGSAPLPALAPGASAVVEVPWTVPDDGDHLATGGAALLKFDLVSAGERFAMRGVVPLQVPLAITGDGAPAEPTPTPDPAGAGEPDASTEPAPASTPAPDPGPTPTPPPTGVTEPVVRPTRPPSPSPSPSSPPDPGPTG